MSGHTLIRSLLAFSLVLLMVPQSSLAGKKLKVKVCTVTPEGTPWEQTAKEVFNHIREDSDGQVKLKVYWSGAKGEEPECLQKVLKNKLQMYAGTGSGVAALVPEMEVLDMPFVWDSTEQADFVIDNFLTEPMRALLAKNGLVFYQWGENGWHGFGSKGNPIKTPEDLKGFKMRVQPSTIHPIVWKEFGAEAHAIHPGEVIDGLADGKITGFSHTPLYAFAAGWQSQITHFTVSKHLYQPGLILYGKTFFDGLEPRLQKILTANAKEDAAHGRALVRKLAPQLIENLRSYGIKLYELSPTERAAFAPMAKKARAAYEAQASPDVKAMLKAIDKGKAAYKK